MGARGDCDAKVPKALSANELSGTVTGPVVQARTIQGDVRIQVDAGPQAPPPAQLAPAPALFIDRHRELSELDELLGAERTTAHAPALIVISGLGGVGKSALALHWLHRIRDRFPDGQLYADLRGSDQGQPVSVSEVLERFLRALGIAPERVPAELDEQVALFRSATAGRRLAVLLDNALSAAQVRSLLPASPYGLVCVTTRHRLSGLIVDGARFVELAPLAEDAATELLTRVVGEERVSAEPEAARELAGLCGMLPIALCASAARLASHRRRSIARLVRELRDARRRLSMLSLDEEISVQAALDVSYNGLPEDQARLYRLVGLHPGDDFTAEVAGAAAGVDPGEAADLLDALAGDRFADITLELVRTKICKTLGERLGEPGAEHDDELGGSKVSSVRRLGWTATCRVSTRHRRESSRIHVQQCRDCRQTHIHAAGRALSWVWEVSFPWASQGSGSGRLCGRISGCRGAPPIGCRTPNRLAGATAMKATTIQKNHRQPFFILVVTDSGRRCRGVCWKMKGLALECGERSGCGGGKVRSAWMEREEDGSAARNYVPGRHLARGTPNLPFNRACEDVIG